MIVDYIDSHRERFGVEPVCAVLAEAGIKIAPSTYYARSRSPLTDAELGEAYLANQLRSLWQDNWGVYGARKLWHAARRAGYDLGRDQVARLMKIAGITGTIRGRHRTRTSSVTGLRRGIRIWSGAAGRCRPAVTSCGWPTSPMCGPWPGSSTSRSSSTCSPAGSWAGGSPPPNTPAWSPTPSVRPCRTAVALSTRGPPPG